MNQHRVERGLPAAEYHLEIFHCRDTGETLDVIRHDDLRYCPFCGEELDQADGIEILSFR